MRKGKIILIGITALALGIAVAVVYVLININSIVKEAIEKYGSQAAKTEVGVSSVDIRLSTGEGTVRRLSVSNPKGFKPRDIFSLENISVRMDIKTVSRSLIVIQEIRISGPEVFYEMNRSGVSNIEVLKKNMETAENGKKTAKRKPGEKEVKLYIKKLLFEKGRVEARVAALGERPIQLNLPRLEMSEIGINGGAAPSEVARIVITALAEETAKVVARSEGEKYLKRGAERLLKRYRPR